MSDINEKPKRKRRGGRPPQSGAFSLLIKSGIDDLPDRRKYLRPYLTGAREGWIRDLGPTEADLTTSQKILVDRAVTFLGAIRLVEEYLKERGLFENPGGFLNAHLAQHYLAWNRALVDALRLLGIDKRKTKERELGVLEVIAEYAKAEVQPVEDGPGSAQEGQREVDPRDLQSEAREASLKGRN